MIDHKKLLGIIEEICHQPKWFTRKGAYNEVAGYLEKSGAENCRLGEINFHSVFIPFLRWFADRPDTLKTIISLKGFRVNFASDDEATKELPFRYKEFIEGFNRDVSNISFHEK